MNQGVATTDSPTFAAATVTGEITANGGIALGDNDTATFGAGDDLQIYHDGSASRIVDSGTGGLTLQADANVVIQNSAGTETKAEFTTDGGVNLYYDNAAKLATTSTGIDVTGNMIADGVGIGTSPATGYKMDILGASGYDDIMRITGVGTNIGPRINLAPTGTGISRINATANSLQLQTSGTPALTIDSSQNVGIGVTDGDVTNDGTAARTYVGIIGSGNRGRLNLGSTASNGADSGTVSFVNGANELGAMYMDSASGSQTVGQMYITSTGAIDIRGAGGVVFNENSLDADFRVESSGNANMLFVDGGDNRVGIGKVPSSTLTVSNTANSDGGLIADFGGYDAGQRLIVANYSCGSDESRAGLYWENQGVVNMRMWMADTGKLYLKDGNPTSSTDGDRILTDQANVGGTGDRGFNIPNGDRLGFDQTGTRSWTVKAAGGALTIHSGDGNGEVTIAPYFHAAKGLTIGSTTGLAVSTTGWGREYVLSADYNSLARTVTLHTNASYFQAKVTIATQQSNGGNDNNRWIEGVWSNNHTTHLWKEFVDVGYTGINETITAGVGNSGSNSGKLVIARAYQASASGTFRVKIENVGYITGMTWAVT